MLLALLLLPLCGGGVAEAGDLDHIGGTSATAPSPWFTLPSTGGQEQVRVQLLYAYRTPRVCVRYGNCSRGSPRGDFLVFGMRLHSVSMTRNCRPNASGFKCAGEFSGVFNFGPGLRACPSSGPPPEEAGVSSCASGFLSWSNASSELPGGFSGGDFSDPSRVVGDFVPGSTINYRYLLTLAYPPGYDRRVHSLADIWISLDGSAVGPPGSFVTLGSLWPGGRPIHKDRVR
jgi:hypothetical protein